MLSNCINLHVDGTRARYLSERQIDSRNKDIGTQYTTSFTVLPCCDTSDQDFSGSTYYLDFGDHFTKLMVKNTVYIQFFLVLYIPDYPIVNHLSISVSFLFVSPTFVTLSPRSGFCFSTCPPFAFLSPLGNDRLLLALTGRTFQFVRAADSWSS